MYQLPPFFTLQPVPATLLKQLSMWAAVVLDHASVRAMHAKPPGESVDMRLYAASSPLFSSAKLRRALSEESVQQLFEYMADKFPNQCALLRPPEATLGDGSMLLVSCVHGGFETIEKRFYRWVLEESASATTVADLSKTGVVLTFDELAEGRCLTSLDRPTLHLSGPPLVPDDIRDQQSGAASDEVILRVFLQLLSDRSMKHASTGHSFRVRLFNLDGSSDPPYDGVKIGG